MARGIGSLVKSAVGSVAQVPGAEDIVMQAVRDIFKELKQLRRENDGLRKQVDRLQQRLAGQRSGSPSRPTASRAKPVTRKPAAKRAAAPRRTTRSSPSTRRAPQRRGGILGDLLG